MNERTLVLHMCECGAPVFCDNGDEKEPKRCHKCHNMAMRPVQPFVFQASNVMSRNAQ